LKVSLILTTYNWPEALAATLSSVLRQTYHRFEVIVADDGSAPQTADTIRSILGSAPIPWRHVRHEDNGIRQARIKNLAVKYAGGDYFIFIDHDVVLHPEFIRDHVGNAGPSCFLQGKRVFLSPELTDRLITGARQALPSPWARGLENRKNGFRSPVLAKWLNREKKFQVTLRGCNLSMSRNAFITVDGYDERFDGLWGREDSDICYRLFNSGQRIKNLWLAGLQYHLHHPSIKRKGRDRLDEELDACLKEIRTRAIHGYSKLSAEGKIVAGNR
jgi:glycosyltransferase involved in cell wall biosynthesis